MKDEEIIQRIISYLKSKGKIKAALLSKLSKHFCKYGAKSKNPISEEYLIQIIIELLRKRTIDIIIPELFSIHWEKKMLKGLKYFPNGVYYIRSPKKDLDHLSNFETSYFFDSRKLDFSSKKVLKEIIPELKKIIQLNDKIKKKIIVYYPKESLSLDIYGKNLKKYYELVNWNNKINKKFMMNKSNIQYPLKNQRLDLSIMGKYRNSYMCFYITLIESLQKKIYDLQKSYSEKKNVMIKYYTEKFAHYCHVYVYSDWVEISKPNPLRWETFFNLYDLPIEILEFKFKSLNFHGNVFDSWIKLKIAVPIKKQYENLIEAFNQKGLQNFSESNEYIKMGFNIDIFLPCPSIEYFYFVVKYIYFYYLFLLFNYIFEYFEKELALEFSTKEQELYRIFSPVLGDLFSKDDEENKLIFKFYTYNQSELELIYNKFLLKKIKNIEKKLFKYFLMKSSKSMRN